MAGTSKIEWTDATWNPIVGCSVVSPGCTNCYAMKMAARIIAMAGTRDVGVHYDRTIQDVKGKPVWTGVVNQAPDHILTSPLRWRKPRRIFVNSMGDLFHESVPDEWIDRVFAVMALCPQHTFQVLTKRAERMRDYFSAWPMDGEPDRITELAADTAHTFRRGHQGNAGVIERPMRHVWLGVSAERQQEADERIPLLLQTPAAIRFVSLEPLLGPIDLTRLCFNASKETAFNALAGRAVGAIGSRVWDVAPLNWVIVGGESGPDARLFDIDWARSLLKQCRDAGGRAFMKQLGSNPHSNGRPMYERPRGKYDDPAEWPPELRIREMPNAA